MTREEKLQLNRDRQKAVREAWAREKSLCAQGKGTVDWSRAQQAELMSRGKVSGFEGQHMKSVSAYPEHAADPNNIQLLSHEDHLAAHNSGQEQSGYRSPTNGCYDPETGTMHSFGDGPPQAVEVIELSDPCCVQEASLSGSQTFSTGAEESLSVQQELDVSPAAEEASGGQEISGDASQGADTAAERSM